MNELNLFAAAIAIADPAERAALLERKCAGRPRLRQRLDDLLAAHFQPNSFLAPAAIKQTRSFATQEASTQCVQFPIEAVGTMIAGRYKLLQQIGEAGMGSVWMAVQTEPVKRKVAVKLIRAEPGQSRTILSRFKAEQQAIAIMDHPHIAKLLDAGSTAAGCPFFVMELVEGIPLSAYCDANKLSVRERLELFMKVCSAVQHAHQKGIIHRDLKPSNILVESREYRPIPKVIDFGLAKATSRVRLCDNPQFTACGTVVGTPLYMAPEQASFSAVDVDTRADLYALGVILYELLTGTTPITRESLKQTAFDEMLRLIREQDAPPPSSRLSAVDSNPSIAANRQIEPQKLCRLVKGELDWIVMKALSKERDRRYDTANGLARDIERFLSHEPVAAGPPGTWYKLRKFIRRNRAQAVAVSLVLLTLLAGVVGTTLGLLEARRQAEIAGRKEQDASTEKAKALLAAEEQRKAKTEANLKRVEAERNLAFAKQGTEILGSVFAGLNPKAKYETIAELRNAMRDNLTRAASELEGSAIGDPLEVAELQNSLAEALAGLGDAQMAIELFTKSLNTRSARLGPVQPETLASMNSLAEAYRAQGRLADAARLHADTLNQRKAKLGPNHPDTLISMSNLALTYNESGQPGKSASLLEEVMTLAKTNRELDHATAITTRNNLALAYQASGQIAKALPLFDQTQKQLIAVMGADHPHTLASMNNLAEAYLAGGQPAKAVPLLEDALQRMKAKLGPDHPTTLIATNNLAGAYRASGQAARAMPLLEQTLKQMKAKLGPDHPSTLVSMNNLAEAYLASGQPAKALPLLEEALKLAKTSLGPAHRTTLTIKSSLALARQANGQLAEAMPALEDVHKQLSAGLGPDHPDTLISMNNLAEAYRASGQPAKAQPLFEETLKAANARLGPDHPNTVLCTNNLARLYQTNGDLKTALPLFEQAAQALEKLSFQHEYAYFAVPHTIRAYEDAQQDDRAAEWRRKWLGNLKERGASESPAYADVLATWGQSLLRGRRWTEAEAVVRDCLAIRAKTQPDNWRTFNTQALLGGALLGQKRYTDAERLLLDGYNGMKVREQSIPHAGGAEFRIPEALDRIIELSGALSKPDQMKKYRELRAAYSKSQPREEK
jgi:serine/threonine protein kinase/tetratricopeptide (TPR) repeat protein